MARRIVPVSPILRAMDSDFDEETLNNLATLAQMQNEPELDVSGTSMPPQNAQQQFQDVPRQMSDRQPGMWERFVKYAQNEQPPQQQEQLPLEDASGVELLGNIAQNEAQEDSLDAVAETEPPEQYQLEPLSALAPQQQEQPQPEMVQEQAANEQVQNISPLDFIRTRVQEDPSLMELLPPETRAMLENSDTPQAQHHMNEVNEMEPVPGAVKAGLSDPNIKQFMDYADNLAGKGYQKEINQAATDGEQIFWKLKQMGLSTEDSQSGAIEKTNLKSFIDSLSDSEKSLLERSVSNELTNDEVVGLGLSVLIPSLLALFYGKEAALGAIGGGLQSIGQTLEGRKKQSSEVGSQLEKIREKKTDLLDKDRKLSDELNKKITSPTVRDIVNQNGTRTLEEYGTIGVPVLEDLGVYLDLENLTEDNAKLWKTEWPQDRKDFAIQKESDKSLADIDDAFEAIKDFNPGYYNAFLSQIKGFGQKDLRDAWGESKVPYIDILEDGKLKRVNALNHLSSMVNKFQTLYINQQKLGGKLTDNVKIHAQEIVPNPTQFATWLAKDAEDMQHSVKLLRNVLNRGFVEDASAKGYVKGALKAQFPYSETKVFRETGDIQGKMGKDIDEGKPIDYEILE